MRSAGYIASPLPVDPQANPPDCQVGTSSVAVDQPRAAESGPGGDEPVAAAIVTPLTFSDALDLVAKYHDEPWAEEERRIVNGTRWRVRLARLLMAVDLASREQERDRAAEIVEADIDGPLDPMGRTLRRLAQAIRDPEASDDARP